MKQQPAIPVDLLDKDGNLERIEFYKEDGEHIMDAIWDPNDEQTKENRDTFRKWAYNFINNNHQFKVKL